MRKLIFAVVVFFAAIGIQPVFADEVDNMIVNLKNGDEEIREEAAQRLGQLGDPRAVPPLIQALRDEEDEVVEKAAEALGQIGSPEAVEPLLDVLDVHTLDWGIRVKTAKALEMIGDPRALPVLNDALKYEENPFVLSHFRRAIHTLESRQKRQPEVTPDLPVSTPAALPEEK